MKKFKITYRIITLSILFGLLSIVSHDLVAHNHSEHKTNSGVEQLYELVQYDSHCFLCDFHKTNKFASVDFKTEVQHQNLKTQQILLNDCRLFKGHKYLNSGRSPPVELAL